MKRALCSVIFLIFLTDLYAGDRAITATFVKEAPKIDGNITDTVWSQGVWFSDFYKKGLLMKKAEVQTEFQIAYDDQYLYLAAKMHEPCPSKLKIDSYKQTAEVLLDDSFELMIDPYGDRIEYFHFATNAAGIKTQARRLHYGDFSDEQWRADWDVATKIGKDYWSLEAAIPFAILSLNEKSVGFWSFNINRNRFTEIAETSSFSPFKEDVYLAENFAKLNLPTAVLSKYLWSLRGPYDCSVYLEEGRWFLEGVVDVENRNSPISDVNFLLKQESKKSSLFLDSVGLSVEPGKEERVRFKVPVQRASPIEITTKVVNRKESEEILAVLNNEIAAKFNPLEIKLLWPVYRNSIYASSSIDEVKFKVNFSIAKSILDQSYLLVKLINANNKKVLHSYEYSCLEDKDTYIYILPEMNSGEYELVFELYHEDSALLDAKTMTLNKLKPALHEWYLDKTGTLYHNAERVFPFGWFHAKPEELEESSHISNTIFDTNKIHKSTQELLTDLDAALKKNMYMIISPLSDFQLMHHETTHAQCFSLKQINEIKERVHALRKHPAMMAWCLCYTAEVTSTFEKKLNQLYKIIAKEDPYHPCIIINSSEAEIELHKNSADISLVWSPVGFIKNQGPSRPLDFMTYCLDVANDNKKRGQTVWAGLQAKSKHTSQDFTSRAPNFFELRNMFYQALIRNSKGLFWYNYEYFPNYPDVNLGIPFLMKELSMLKPVLEGNPIDSIVNISCANFNPIYHQIYESYKKEKCLIVANTADLAQNIQFKVSALAGKQLYVLSENRWIEVTQDGSFSDYFKPYDVHVYTDFQTEHKHETVAQVYSNIQCKDFQRRKPGNLAFEDKVSLTASSNSKLTHLNSIKDGVLSGISWQPEMEALLPVWVELTWKDWIRASKVILYSDSIEKAQLQAKVEGVWTTVSDFSKKSSAELEADFSPMYFNQMRVLITAKKSRVETIAISEIEVFDQLEITHN